MENYNEKIKELIELRKHSVDKAINADFKKNIEIKKSKEEIEEKYSKIKEDIENNILSEEVKINELKNKIVRCGCFHRNDIIPVLLKLMRIYEGDKFEAFELHYHFDPKRLMNTKEALLILNSNRRNFLTNEDCYMAKLHSLEKNGDGIILSWELQSSGQYVSFYEYNSIGDIKSNVKLNMFPYIKEFIDFLISYSIENDMKLTHSKIKELMDKFVLDNIDSIKKYSEIIEFEERNKFDKIIKQNSNYREKQLNKVLRRNNNV